HGVVQPGRRWTDVSSQIPLALAPAVLLCGQSLALPLLAPLPAQMLRPCLVDVQRVRVHRHAVDMLGRPRGRYAVLQVTPDELRVALDGIAEAATVARHRSEEHTSELQSPDHL